MIFTFNFALGRRHIGSLARRRFADSAFPGALSFIFRLAERGGAGSKKYFEVEGS